LQSLGVRPDIGRRAEQQDGVVGGRDSVGHDERVEVDVLARGAFCVIADEIVRVPTFSSFRPSARECRSFSGSPDSPMVRSMLQRTGPCLARSISARSRKSLGIDGSSESVNAFSPSSGTKRQRTSVTLSARSMNLNV